MKSLMLSTAAIVLSAGIAVAQDSSNSSSSSGNGSMNSDNNSSMSSDTGGSMNSNSGSMGSGNSGSMSSDSGSSMSSDSGSSMSSDSSGSSNQTPSIQASDQSVSNGIVSARSVTAAQNGWMVVHRTDSEMAPGPVVGHAPLRAGSNQDVAAILTEDVSSGDMLMLMVHSEEGGSETGIFEYTLGASEDGPIRMDGDLVTSVITAQ